MRALCHDWPSRPARSCPSADHRAVPTSCCRAADTGRECRGRLGGLAHHDPLVWTPACVAQCRSFPHNGYGLHERLQDPGAWLDVVQQMNASEHILRLTPELAH